jgi:hypothetical protein
LDKPKGKDPDGDNGNPPTSNRCKGKADGACCAGNKGEHWCQGGSCVAVPDYGTITQCRGACGTGPERSVTVCGATMSCPFCIDPDGCDDWAFCEGIMGPFGIGSYCVRETGFVCSEVTGACEGTAQCCPFVPRCVELRFP